MKTLELFSGTKSFSKVAKELGHSTFTIDNDPKLNPDLCCDILELESIDQNIDVLWASVPCETYSVASIGKHWTGGSKAYIPKTQAARIGLALLYKTISLIAEYEPKLWYIENPRGVMKKIIGKIFAKYGIDYIEHEIWYCRYSDTRAKPTNIWTNDKQWIPRPSCHNGNPDHEPAPRGSKTGTQGLKGAKERGVIPPELFYEIFRSHDAIRTG